MFAELERWKSSSNNLSAEKSIVVNNLLMKTVPKIFHALLPVENHHILNYSLTWIHKPTKTKAAKINSGYTSALLWPFIRKLNSGSLYGVQFSAVNVI